MKSYDTCFNLILLRYESTFIASQLQVNDIVIDLFSARLVANNVAKTLGLWHHHTANKIYNQLDVANIIF